MSVQTVRIVNVEDVEASLDNLQIIDARPVTEYEQGHIPGSTWMGWESWCAQPPVGATQALHQRGYWGVLREVGREGEQGLRARSMDLNRPIVVYANGLDSRGREGRIAWMLLYFGARNIALLDGGWAAWKEAGGETERGLGTQQNEDFEVRLQAKRRMTLNELRVARGVSDPPVLIDTRTLDEFSGNGQHYLTRRGHIPGSVCLPYTLLFQSNGGYIAKEAFNDLLDAHGVRGRNCVAYCEVGVRAALLAVLCEAYTAEVMPVYDGSFVEWASQADLPVATVPAGG